MNAAVRPYLERWRTPSLRRTVASTALVNIGLTVAAAASGIYLARVLGPAGRGDYAALSSWFGLMLTIGAVGQPAATTYYVASLADRRRDVVATSRTLMLVVGFSLVGVMAALAPLLAHGDHQLTVNYWIVFLSGVPAFAGSSYSFALQAASIPVWNLMRASQPIAYLVLVVAVGLAGALDLRLACQLLLATVTGQAMLSYVLCRRLGLTGGRSSRVLGGHLLRYGLSQVASTAPATLNARLDQLVLSQTVRSASLGQYAVAVTLTGLAVPVVSALGNVLFPRMAAERDRTRRDAIVRQAVVSSLVLAVVVVGLLTATAYLVVPLLFGEAFRDAVPLVWILAPGGVFLASSQVCGDLLRGQGRPIAVAWAQVAGVVITIVGLAVLLPWLGVPGAAAVSTVAYAVTWLMLLRSLRSDPTAERIEVGAG